ncbi:MAG: hypothetical protein PHI63_02415 [Patescibacteria group bacterium]|nr:hypothetical protein [Patescibacteria group bacterium]
MAINEAILKFLRDNVGKFPKDIAEAQLRNSGYAEEDIHDSFTAYEQSLLAAPSSPFSKRGPNEQKKKTTHPA